LRAIHTFVLPFFANVSHWLKLRSKIVFDVVGLEFRELQESRVMLADKTRLRRQKVTEDIFDVA
jgi:hypothetical protein